MALHLTLREVYEMAEQVERRGLRFYHLAAAATHDEATRKLFLSLAGMESDHEQVFSAIKSGLLALPPEAPMEKGVGEQLAMITSVRLTFGHNASSAYFTGLECV